jgi:hypothetical protein
MGIISAILLTACAQLPVPTDLPPPLPPDEACGDVVEFYVAISRLPDAAGADMLQALRTNALPNDEACGRLRLALLLSRPGTAHQDDETAVGLLTAFLRNPILAQHPARGLALLLVDDINERCRLRAQARALQRRLEQGQTTAQAQTLRLEQEQTAAAVLRRQLNALRSQLDQLKSIEQDINEKERAGAGTNPPTDKKNP